MSINIPDKLCRLEGFKLSATLDCSKLTKRKKNAYIKQLQTGVFNRTSEGNMLRYLVGETPVKRWWDAVIVDKRFVNDAVMDQINATKVTKALRNVVSYYDTSPIRAENFCAAYGKDYEVIFGPTGMVKWHIDLSVNPKWMEIVSPLIEQIANGETITIHDISRV